MRKSMTAARTPGKMRWTEVRSHIRRTGAGLKRLLAVEDGGACGM